MLMPKSKSCRRSAHTPWLAPLWFAGEGQCVAENLSAVVLRRGSLLPNCEVKNWSMTNEPTAQNGATITYPRNIRLTEPPMPAGSTIGRRWASVHSAGATCQPHFFPFRSRATAGQVSTRRAGTIGEWDRRCVMQQPSYGRRNQQHRSGHTTCAATEDRATHHQQYHHKRLKSRVGRLNLRTVVLLSWFV